MADIQSAAPEIRRGKKRRKKEERTRMWANAQPDGRPAEHRWRPLLNAAVWLSRRYCCLTSFFPIVDMCLSCECGTLEVPRRVPPTSY